MRSLVACLSASQLVLALVGKAGAGTIQESKADTLRQQTYTVTPVSGPSWLKQLGISVSQTRMGQMGGTAPARVSPRREPLLQEEGNVVRKAIQQFLSYFRLSPDRAAQAFREPFLLSGADLYRLSCQSCHGSAGTGAPPEIKSLLDPVRGASPAAIKRRMADRGASIDDAMAVELATQAEGALRDRLSNGGKRMPPFRHLRRDEVDALFAYLKTLAGVPDASGPGPLVSESAARVGEHVVKGVCHICHAATGPGGGHMAMMRGTIPSLASFPRQESLSAVLRQVKYGSSGRMMMMRAQQMPALPFLTQDEAAAAYFFLADYPPEP